MALIGIDISGQKDYVSPRDPDKGGEGATVWVIGTLTARQRMFLKDRSLGFESDGSSETGLRLSFNGNTTAYDTVRVGLVSVKNFKDSKGEVLEFKRTKDSLGGLTGPMVPTVFMDRLDSETIRELSSQITQDNELSLDEAGNFEG